MYHTFEGLYKVECNVNTIDYFANILFMVLKFIF